MVEKTQFKMEFPTMDTRTSERTITDISDYYLTRDKLKREIVSSQMDGYAGLECYALNVTKELHE